MSWMQMRSWMTWSEECLGKTGAKISLHGYRFRVFVLIISLGLIIPLAIFAEIYFLNESSEPSPPVELELANFFATVPLPATAGASLWMKDSGAPNFSGFTGCRAGEASGYFRSDRDNAFKNGLTGFGKALIILMVFIFYQSSRTSSEEELVSR